MTDVTQLTQLIIVAEIKPGQLDSVEQHSTEAPRTHVIQAASKATDPSFTQFLDLEDWVGVSKTSAEQSGAAMLSLPNPRLK